MDRQTRINQAIGQEIRANAAQVAAAVKLLDEGATVPFIARYRKEATDGLDDTQLRTLAERLTYSLGLFIIQLAAIKLREPQLNEVGGDITGALRIAPPDDTGADVLEALQLERHRMSAVGTS